MESHVDTFGNGGFVLVSTNNQSVAKLWYLSESAAKMATRQRSPEDEFTGQYTVFAIIKTGWKVMMTVVILKIQKVGR